MESNDYKKHIREGEELFVQGNYDQALRIFEDVLSLDPLNVEALNDAGLACEAMSDPAAAARYFEHTLHIDAHFAPAFFNLLDLLIRVGDADLIVEAFVQYEGGVPDSLEKERYRDALFGTGDGASADAAPAALVELSKLTPIHELLRSIHAELRPEAYVEIGVGLGASLALAGPDTFAVGIDSRSDVQVPLSDRTKLFSTTSDAFFRERNLAEELDGRPVELALIDGMHLFEYALRDFMNLERCCSAGAVILVPGTYPADAAAASRERKAESWSGDVWKLILCLKKYRPDLSIQTVDVDPAGLAIIANLDSNSTVLAANMEAIYREYIPMSFDVLTSNKAELLSRIDNDHERIRSVICGRAMEAEPVLLER